MSDSVQALGRITFSRRPMRYREEQSARCSFSDHRGSTKTAASRRDARIFGRAVSTSPCLRLSEY